MFKNELELGNYTDGSKLTSTVFNVFGIFPMTFNMTFNTKNVCVETFRRETRIA